MAGPDFPPLPPGVLPYRGRFGDARPAGLPPLPPAAMPSHRGLRPLQAWRYVGWFGPELMACAASVRIGPFRQGFYALLDRSTGRLHQRIGGHVELGPGRVRIIDRALQLEISLAEDAGIETVTAVDERSYAWTRKQGGIRGQVRVMLDGQPRALDGFAIVDDSAGYHPRHTRWRWCAGVGTASNGEALAWNLVEGVHDSRLHSERTLWVDGDASELAPTPIAADLGRAGDLIFTPEATRVHNENRLLVRSRYRQPFGTFAGAIGGLALSAGAGVMEDHDVYW